MLGAIGVRYRKDQKRSETRKLKLTRPASFLAGRRSLDIGVYCTCKEAL